MRKLLLIAACGAALTLPTIASAQDSAGGAMAGAGVGAATGFVVGGPIGAAVGAGVGGVVGAGAADNNRRVRAYGYAEPSDTVVIERRSRVHRDCVRDSFGNKTCTEYRR
jgi:uncharacterized membrane protein